MKIKMTRTDCRGSLEIDANNNVGFSRPCAEFDLYAAKIEELGAEKVLIHFGVRFTFAPRFIGFIFPKDADFKNWNNSVGLVLSHEKCAAFAVFHRGFTCPRDVKTGDNVARVLFFRMHNDTARFVKKVATI